MPRTASSLAAVIDDAVRDVVARAAKSVASTIADLAAAEAKKQIATIGKGGVSRRGASRARRRLRAQEMTKWVADNRARRVPKFVIELTGGLDTKKKIVARYGANAVFEKGRPLPKAG